MAMPGRLTLAALEAALPELGGIGVRLCRLRLFRHAQPRPRDRCARSDPQRTGLPVTCSHELSSKLGGPRRALTTLLNARLISMIDRLCGDAKAFSPRAALPRP